jgi:hypothetical protein
MGSMFDGVVIERALKICRKVRGALNTRILEHRRSIFWIILSFVYIKFNNAYEV